MTNYEAICSKAIDALTLRGKYRVDGRLVGAYSLRDDLTRRLARFVGAPVCIRLQRGKGHNSRIWVLILD